MNNIKTNITVELGAKSYPIIIGWDILAEVGDQLQHLFLANKKVLIISNQTVFQLFGETVTSSLTKQGFIVKAALVPDGEAAKSWQQAAAIYKNCCEIGLDRNSIILALGGGVVGDLAGFIAATYMRGINFVQIPTTLLAQVDSSVGGKVGINLPEGKNLVGAFYQPKLVYIDLKTLATLPGRELRTGLAEIIKYGVLDGEKFFSYLEQQMDQLLSLDVNSLSYTVKKSCHIKSEIVSKDELEDGLRAILNLGHTIGHALETLSGYQLYRHGEAVAIGMKYAGLIGLKLNYWSLVEQKRLENLIKVVGLPAKLPDFSAEKILAAMALDKKNYDGKLTMIVPKQIGQVEIIQDINLNIIKQVLADV